MKIDKAMLTGIGIVAQSFIDADVPFHLDLTDHSVVC